MSPTLEELEDFAPGQAYIAEMEELNYWIDENQNCSFNKFLLVKIHCTFAVTMQWL